MEHPRIKPISRKRRLFPILAVLTLCALPYFAHAVSLIPLNAGMQMTCQFVNNTGGQYSDSQIYVVAISQNASGQYCHLDASGNMVPCVAGENGSSYFLSLNQFPGFQFPPVMTSARLYVSLGSPLNIPINPGTPVGIAYPNISNPSDPSINTSFDWIEYNIGGGMIFCNTTQVDMFGISMLMDLYDNGASGPTLNGEVGTTESTSALMSEYLSAVPAAFAGLEGPIRIVAPLHGSFGNGGANAGYFDAYINSVWAEYSSSDLVITLNSGTYTGRVGSDGRLAFTTPGDSNTYYVSKPSTNDVWGGAGNLATGNGTELALEAQICGAFHRHVIDNAANLNNVPAYYQTAPTDFYSQFWHQHNVNAKAYGFCYDDTNNQSSSLISGNPRAIVLSIGGGTALTPTPTPTPVIASTWRVNAGGPQYSDSQGKVWSADENYSGGSAAVTTSGITGALPGAGDQALYQSQRWGSPFTYVFNVSAGSYQATLKFAETYWTAAGARVFNVSINGNTALTNFDIFKTAGGQNMALDEVFNNIAPSGGAITIQFGPASVDNAMVDAIQILPMPSTPTFTPTVYVPTNTPTSTFTNTFTSTKTSTPTWTWTSTFTMTSTHTTTSTNTPVPPTNTPTNTSTFTNTNTDTSTRTYTPVPPSSTPTSTSSSTRTFTATSTHTAIPPTSTPTFTFTNTPANTSTNTPADSMTATPTDTSSPTPSFTSTATNTTTGTFTSTASYTPTASYTFTPKPILTSTATGTATPNQTPSWTLSFTSTPSHTPTPTDTFSPTPTGTATKTLTPSATASPTPTSTTTPTFTATIASVVEISAPYPNPSNGSPISFNVSVPGKSTVTMDVFTLAFRKVTTQAQEIYGNQTIYWDLKNRSGVQAANGLYYLSIHVTGGQSTTKILKVLILR